MARKSKASMPNQIPKSFQDRYTFSNNIGTCTMLDGTQFKFLKKDFDKIKSYKWRFARGRVVSYGEKKRKDTDLAKIILGDKIRRPENKKKHIIFLNRNPLDYRRSNLAFATYSQKLAHGKTPKNNTSGVTGVSFVERVQKWRAYITINRKQIPLGYYETIDGAIKARLKSELEHFGKFAPQSHLFEQYGITSEEIKDAVKQVNKKQLKEDKEIRYKQQQSRYINHLNIWRTEQEIEHILDYEAGVNFAQEYCQTNYYYE